MNDAIAVRLGTDLLRGVDTLALQETEDRSTVIRKLVARGLAAVAQEKAVQQYREGKLSLSGAAKTANLTLWDFQELLVQKGFVSDYSLDMIKEDLKVLEKAR